MHQPVSPSMPDAGFQAYLREQQRLPASTYRLQLHAGFTFNDARGIVDYLDRLGISACYSSPCFRARPGSTHGYDICDYNQLNPELGSEADFDAWADALRSRGMGLVIDFVPNHMAAHPVLNPWWRDMLENGRASPHARFFDVDWDPVKPELKNKVLLSVLGDHYGLVLERGELKLDLEQGALVLRYFDVHRPIDPRHYPVVFRRHLEALEAELGAEDAQLLEFLSILTALDNLPYNSETNPERVALRQREKKVAAERLARLLEAAPRIRRHIEEVVQSFNGRPGAPASFDALHELLEEQAYRLAYWRTAAHEINYRRFFDINELAGLRMEDRAVFDATHGLVMRLIREGKITGLRLDHIDGLYDPSAYVTKLQAAVLQERAVAMVGGDSERDEQRRQLVAGAQYADAGTPGRGIGNIPFYLVVEKILSSNESLPEIWPIHGTTGYDFMNDVVRLLVDPQNANPMRRVYERFTDQEQPFGDVVYRCKELVSETALASELNVLAHALNGISEGNRRARDFTLDALKEALREVVTCFPVYRTYIGVVGSSDADRQMIELALSRARFRNPAMESTVFDFLRDNLMPQREQTEPRDKADEQAREKEYQRRLNFAMKVQQYTGPLQAKGVEDTAFYRYNVLLALNEVGGDPQRFGGPASLLHDANRRRLTHWPYTMLATATHDTKRGEDARARLAVLSEAPDDWRRHLFFWTRINASHRTTFAGGHAPDRNDEYFFYQALLGAWPAEPTGTSHEAAPRELIDRLQKYMQKAMKEAKVHTSWISPNQAYDDAVTSFIEKTLAGPRTPRFLASFLPFQQRIARLGMINSLAQAALKVISPGVPDFYQGTELWDLSLVDPDNRRPVDFGRRRQLLEELEPWLEDGGRSPQERSRKVAELLANWHDGRIKMFMTVAGLRWRRRLRHVFLEGEYVALEATGGGADHVVAIGRRHGADAAIAVMPRFSSRITTPEQPLPVGPACWAATQLVLPAEWKSLQFRDVLTGRTMTPQSGQASLPVAEVLRTCSVALLTTA
jgi:(1->4)-alpha-D-glucan 1-alpha-D-glucosylmutase